MSRLNKVLTNITDNLEVVILLSRCLQIYINIAQ